MWEEEKKTSEGEKERYMDTKWFQQRLCRAAQAGSLGDAEAEEEEYCLAPPRPGDHGPSRGLKAVPLNQVGTT